MYSKTFLNIPIFFLIQWNPVKTVTTSHENFGQTELGSHINRVGKHHFVISSFYSKMYILPFGWFYQEMGFPQSQSELAIQAFGTVQAALEALLAGKGKGQNV